MSFYFKPNLEYSDLKGGLKLLKDKLKNKKNIINSLNYNNTDVEIKNLINFMNNCINNGLNDENGELVIKLFLCILNDDDNLVFELKNKIIEIYKNEWKDNKNSIIFNESSEHYYRKWDKKYKVHEDKHHVITYNNKKHKLTLFNVMNCQKGCKLHHHPQFSITCNSKDSVRGGGPNYSNIQGLFKLICSKENLWLSFIGPDPLHSVDESTVSGFGFYRLEFNYYEKKNKNNNLIIILIIIFGIIYAMI
jgi:hypothetical protein